MLIYNGQVIAGGGTIVMPMTRAEYEANKAVLDTADVWIDLTDEPDQVATAEQIAYSVDGVQKSMGYIGDIATKAVAKVEPSDTALYLHEVGTGFINKNGDYCITDVQIAVGGTITLGANCHVLPDGVANDINSKLTVQQDTTTTGLIIRKQGNICNVICQQTTIDLGSQYIHSGFRPDYDVYAPALYVDNGWKLGFCKINQYGNISIFTSSGSQKTGNTQCVFDITYILS